MDIETLDSMEKFKCACNETGLINTEVTLLLQRSENDIFEVISPVY